MDYQEISKLLDRMEALVNKERNEYLSDEEEEERDDLYCDIKRGIGEFYGFESDEKNYEKLQNVKKRFKSICSNFETPDEVKDYIMDIMYPNKDDDFYDD